MATNKDFLGSGIAYPFKFENGRVAIKTYEDKVKASIKMIMDTRIGERVHNPEFGCLGGETLIPLLDGRKISIEELYKTKEKNFFTLGCTPEGKVIPVCVEKAVYKGIKNTLKITLDNGKTITCTLKHPFLTKQGIYKFAKDLVVGESLMPYYTKINRAGYEMVYLPNEGIWKSTHQIVCTPMKGSVIHHKDFNKTNNVPSNLVEMTSSDHIQLHSKQVKKMFEEGMPLWNYYNSQDEKYKTRRENKKLKAMETIKKHNKKYAEDKAYRKKCRLHRKKTEIKNGTKEKISLKTKHMWETKREELCAAISEAKKLWWINHPEQRIKQAKISKLRNAFKQWRKENPELVKSIAKEIGIKYGAKNLNNWIHTEEGKNHAHKLGLSRFNGITAEQILEFAKKQTYKTKEDLYNKIYKKFNISRSTLKRRFPTLKTFPPTSMNHKIIKIEVGKVEKVYDLLNASPTNNFAIESGIFVHNSNVQSLIFEPMDDATKDKLYLYTRDALERWEKRIIIRNVFFEEMTETQGYWIRIEYTYRGTNITGNYVYPFVSEGMSVGNFYTQRVHTALYGG